MKSNSISKFLQNTSYKKSKTLKKPIKKTIKKNASKKLLQNAINQIKNFYILQNTISSHLIHYQDTLTKRLEKQSIHKLGSYTNYSIQDIENNFRRIDLAYRVQQSILEQLNLTKLPQKVQYATEDMTRGLSKFISRRFESSLPHPTISNAFIKLWECLSTFDIIPKSKQVNKYKVFHICEAPGQMILSARYFTSKKRKNIQEYEWFANSLNPFNVEVKQKYGRILGDEYGLIRQNPGKWLWGADNTGDITRMKNIKWFRNRILGHSNSASTPAGSDSGSVLNSGSEGVDLIIGDGGLGSHNDAIVLQKIDLAQVVTVIACSRKGGACIIKHFTPYMTNHQETLDATSFFVSILFLYYLVFNEVSLFKPYSSDMTSGEFYVIGKDFRGVEDEFLDKLYHILDKFKVNQALFPLETIPESFIFQINGFIEQMADYNITGLEKNNLLLTCYKGASTNDGNNTGKSMKKQMDKLLHCNDFLDEDRIEEILVPRYNKWVKLYEFV
jgi:23S rRNA U2552 (ribose-2'-O)-methylase RlmE/FtsJ